MSLRTLKQKTMNLHTAKQTLWHHLHHSKCKCSKEKTDDNLIFISKEKTDENLIFISEKKVAQVLLAACLPPAVPSIGQGNEKLCGAMAVSKGPLRGSQAWPGPAGAKAWTCSWGERPAQIPLCLNGHYSPSSHYGSSLNSDFSPSLTFSWSATGDSV